jgi:choice-of-anchor B domain-containing protein
MSLRKFRGPRRAGWGKTGGRLAIVGFIVALALLPAAVAGREGPVRFDPGSAGGAMAPGDLSLVGSLALPGFNADVWGHKGFAYIGSWGTASNYPARCPATGVRIIDLADPAHPALVGAIATIPGTSQEDIYVASVATSAFTGDLLVTGIQACNRASDAQRGVDLWDVTNPRAPQHLAFWSSGPGGSGAQGGHELDLVVRGDHVYMGVAVPYSESLEHRGDFRMVDLTDPRNPVELSAWGATIDGGIVQAGGQTFFGHSARFNAAGTMVVVSYWDAGAILLDVTDPAHPALIGRTPYPAGAPVANHSTWFAADETLLLSADEYGGPQAGRWGGLRVWDIHDPRNPVQIAEFLTPDAASGRPGGAFQYTIHNPIVRGTTAYLSWYADGVRVLDIADPRAPREIGGFVPPASADPYGYFPPSAMVWGVYSDDDLVLLSDINGGLYVLRTPFSGPQCFAETGHCIQGRFLDYWQAHGGLAINGYPISDELTQTLEDGRSYTVQYFERTRLEYHPDSPPQYQVQLGQFGRQIHPADPPATARGDATYFNETGHNLGGRFLDYWQANGGLAQFGYPLTEEYTEMLEDGQTYTVQYFERARFEYHPENAPPFDVLLGQFGRQIFGSR